MRHLINKDAVVAEIEKELNTTKKYSTEYVNGKKYALNKILSFIDTLEVKEVEEEPVSEDLGEAANTYVNNWYKLNNLDKESYPIDVEISKNDFKAGAKWQKEQLIEKACVFLKSTDFYKYYNREFVKEFVKAMEK